MKTGVSSQVTSHMPAIRQSLVAAIQGADYGKPPVRRPLRLFNGKQPVQDRSNAANDAMVLEVRRLHEQAGMTPVRITSHLASLGYSKTYSWVSSTCNYYNRSHLLPAANAASYLPIPESTKP